MHVNFLVIDVDHRNLKNKGDKGFVVFCFIYTYYNWGAAHPNSSHISCSLTVEAQEHWELVGGWGQEQCSLISINC